jgi:hypothetical protein
VLDDLFARTRVRRPVTNKFHSRNIFLQYFVSISWLLFFSLTHSTSIWYGVCQWCLCYIYLVRGMPVMSILHLFGTGYGSDVYITSIWYVVCQWCLYYIYLVRGMPVMSILHLFGTGYASDVYITTIWYGVFQWCLYYIYLVRVCQWCLYHSRLYSGRGYVFPLPFVLQVSCSTNWVINITLFWIICELVYILFSDRIRSNTLIWFIVLKYIKLIWIRHSLQTSIASTHRHVHVQIVVLGSFLHYSWLLFFVLQFDLPS